MNTSYNWLVYKILNESFESAVKSYAKGILIDIGCGVKPYKYLTNGIVEKHYGIDHLGSQHNKRNVDIFATAYQTGFKTESVDTVLLTAVLEHLETPHIAIKEIGRILKANGLIIILTPLFWHLHEEPRDFYRFTKYGLLFLLKNEGFDIVELKPLAGFIVTFTQEFVYYLNRWRKGMLLYPVVLLQYILQRVAYILNKCDNSPEFTWGYMVIAKKHS